MDLKGAISLTDILRRFPLTGEKMFNSCHNSDNVVFAVTSTATIYPFFVNGARERGVRPALKRGETIKQM